MGGEFLILPLDSMDANILSLAFALAQLNFARDTYRLEYLQYWQTLNLDIVIGPAQPQTAAQLGTSKYWGYTSVRT